jgi:hypothetical protein
MAVDDPVARDWCGLRWTEWQSLGGDSVRAYALACCGIYRIRRAGLAKRLTYVGQTGRTLRERLLELANGTYAEQCRMAKKLKPRQEREIIPRWRSHIDYLLLPPSESIVGAGYGPAGEGELMEWARILAYITGTVDQQLLLRNEYLIAENRILKAQLHGRLRLSDAE